jgi:hypothetical protein
MEWWGAGMSMRRCRDVRCGSMTMSAPATNERRGSRKASETKRRDEPTLEVWTVFFARVEDLQHWFVYLCSQY